MNNAITTLVFTTLLFAALLIWVIMDMPMPESKGGITVEFVDRYGDYDGYGVVR